MREIKFRAWDRIDKRMLNWGELLQLNLQNIFRNICGMTLLQYTGLKDRCGAEIYEGDIVKQTFILCVDASDGGEFINGYHKGEVVIIASKGVCIKNPILNFSDNSEDYRLNQYKNVVGYRSEVIGNIYENPELLEV